MRVAWVLLHLSACGALRLSSTDDPSFEVGPTWIKHRSLSQAAAPAGARLGGCQSGLAVCIVGQLARLETKSKLANLFQFEAQQNTYERVHAFVVAQTGPWFNVSAKNAQAKDDNDTCRQEFHSPSEVEEVLSPYYQAGMYLKPGYHKEVTLNMENWHKYGTDKGEEKRKPRMKSHLAQWSNFAQCAGLIKEHEQATGCQYTAVMKIRDNGIVTKPMSTSVENKVIVKDCFSWGGFNDRFILAPRSYLDQVLEGPLNLALAVNNGTQWASELIRKNKVVNPEMLLSRSWRLGDVPVRKASGVTVVDGGHCVGASNKTGPGERGWCLVPHRGRHAKDCRPRGNLGYATCGSKR